MKVGYARLSTGDPDGLTIEIQHDRLKAAGCERIYSEVISGNASHRPQWEALKQSIADGHVTEVVAYRFDRLSRSWTAIGEVIHLFSQPDAPRLTLTDDSSVDLSTTSGRTVAGVLASVAAGERERIVARSKAELKKRFASGRRIKIPFGVAKDPSGFPIVDRRPMLCTINDKAEHSYADVARAIWSAWEETPTNYSAGRFALKRFGIEAFRGGSAVTWCLNPVLRGALTSGRANRQGLYDTVLENQFEPLIDPEQHKAATAAYLSSRATNNRGRGTNKKATPLSGKVRCSSCGYSLTLHRIVSRPNNEPTFRCRRQGCELEGKRIRYSVLREALRQHLLSKPEAVMKVLIGHFQPPTVDRDRERQLKVAAEQVQTLRNTLQTVNTDDIRRALDKAEAHLATVQASKPTPPAGIDPEVMLRAASVLLGQSFPAELDGNDLVISVPMPEGDYNPIDGVKRLLSAEAFQGNDEAGLVPLVLHHLKVNAATGAVDVVDLLS